MLNKKNPIFKCTQAELYAVCRIMWRSFLRQLAIFTSRKAFYDNAYFTAVMAEIDAAQAIPEAPARIAVFSSFRLQLVTARDNCVEQWKSLISYIETAYDEEFWANQAQVAGSAHLVGAQNSDWEEVPNLMTSGLTFITLNSSALEANNNMPSTFLTDYTIAMENFETIYALFTTAIENAKQKTRIKKAANNAIYKKTTSMGKDGQLYFKKDEVLKNEFIFKKVLRIVSSPGSAGLKGIITNNATGVPLAEVSLSLYEGTNTFVEADYTTTSVEDGSYDFGRMASGSYTLKMECAGFVTRLEAVEILVGVSSSKSFTIVQA